MPAQRTARPADSPTPRNQGATTSAAKNPYTTVGIPASNSSRGLATARKRGLEYSARKMADIKPMGTATNIAMTETSMVPVSKGTTPKAPDEPTWSARIAVCGLQLKPNRKSVTGTRSKKLNDAERAAFLAEKERLEAEKVAAAEALAVEKAAEDAAAAKAAEEAAAAKAAEEAAASE